MQADVREGGKANGSFSVWELMTRGERDRPDISVPGRKSKEHLGLGDVFRRVPLPIVVVRGFDLVIEAANEAAERLAAGPAVGFRLNEAVPEMALQSCLASLHDAMAGIGSRDAVVCEFEQRPTPERPERCRWKVRCRRLNGPAAEVKGLMVVVFTDVTAEAARLDALRQWAAKADAGNRARDQFLAMLSHELRTPLAPIVSSLERIRAKGAHTCEQAVIERQVRHLQRLVEDLLDIAGIVRGALVLRKRTIDMAEIVAASIERVMPVLEKAEHRLEVRVPDGLTVVVDPDRMGQVLCNLLVNAAKFSAERSEISIAARAESGRVFLTVADRGVGIAQEYLEDIFEVFVGQQQPVQNAHMAGLGLGLAIVRDVVRRHGGEVWARSKGLGHGSEFTVELPLATETPSVENTEWRNPG